MNANVPSNPSLRLVALGLILLSLPGVLLIDLYLTPWKVPTRILYAVPILVAARLLGGRVAVGVTIAAIAFSIVDAWLTGVEVQAELLSLFGLSIIGLLSVAWADAQRRARALAEERARLYEGQRRRASALEDAHDRLLEFFAMVAHDLRGPLTTMGGYSQMLSRPDMAPEQRERIVAGLSSAVRQMARLADDLQDAARIGDGRFEVQKDRCDLVALARQVVEQRQPVAGSHRLVLAAEDEPIEGFCDADRIVQAISNLIDNAIKYSPPGGEVRVRLERARDRAKLAVSDQGIGMAPEDIPKLFQPYERLRMSPGTKGLGLGLYIVRGIVEAHGGTIVAQSEVGKGSTFTVELPINDPVCCGIRLP